MRQVEAMGRLEAGSHTLGTKLWPQYFPRISSPFSFFAFLVGPLCFSTNQAKKRDICLPGSGFFFQPSIACFRVLFELEGRPSGEQTQRKISQLVVTTDASKNPPCERSAVSQARRANRQKNRPELEGIHKVRTCNLQSERGRGVELFAHLQFGECRCHFLPICLWVRLF